MNPWECLDRAPVPDSDAELQLYRRGEEYSIRVDEHELMNSRAHGSEEALAEIGCTKARRLPQASVLVGGLGMGFTLAAVFRQLGPRARVTVAELVPAVIAWNRGPLAHLSGEALADGRVELFEGDVADLMRERLGSFDAILLDVDNGPEGTTREKNFWLYTESGLRAARSALRPEGVLAVWSEGPDRSFVRRLEQAGFEVEELRAHAHGERGRKHTVWRALPSTGNPARRRPDRPTRRRRRR